MVRLEGDGWTSRNECPVSQILVQQQKKFANVPLRERGFGLLDHD